MTFGKFCLGKIKHLELFAKWEKYKIHGKIKKCPNRFLLKIRVTLKDGTPEYSAGIF